jgi:8-oxo-dGTP pyrophosphatase MutT (NUDIX family)
MPTTHLKPFDVSPSLTSLQANAKTYLSTHPDARRVVSSCLIFQHDAVLLIERCPHASSRATWEVPGGICDRTDETILHSAARETLEEAGLSVKRFNHQVGNGYPIKVKKNTQTWVKVVFDVDVEEAESGNGEFKRYIDQTKIQLSHEHRNWMWATEEQVRTERANQLHLALRVVERAILLDGFALRRAAMVAQSAEDVVMEDV